MAFTIEDYQDLVQLLMENPQWRVELRQLLLSDDFLALPAIVRDLAEAQLRTEERLEALAQRVEELAEAQKRTEERVEALAQRVEALAQRVEELAEAQLRTEKRLEALAQRVEELAQRMESLAQRMEELAEAQKRTETGMQALTNRLSALDGRTFELMYREKATAYFGGLLRRLRVVQPNVLEDALEARLSEEEMLDVFRLDLLLDGRLRRAPAVVVDREVWLAVEVSISVEEEDVERAYERAKYLQKAGYCAIPVVAGKQVYLDIENLARSFSVAMLRDGKVYFWEEALDTWVRSDRTSGQPV